MIAVVAAFAGGIALLLLGLQIAGGALQEVAGGRVRTLLRSVGRHRLLGLAVGAALTAIIQSSSATTVILVGLSGAGIIQLSQTIPIILGADVGTTLTVQILAFRAYDYALLIVAAGFFIQFASRRRRLKAAGTAILGFGLIFTALKILTEALGPLTEQPWVREALLWASAAPVATVVIAAGLTALFHSSAATIGLAIALADQGLIGLPAAVPIILGANIGTSATALIASIGTNLEARRVAFAHILFKILGVALVLPFLRPFSSLAAASAASAARQIANAHTLFNLGLALLFLPLTPLLSRVVTRLIPPPPPSQDPARPLYLDPKVLESPALALGQAARETVRLARVVQTMYRESLDVLIRDDAEAIDRIQESEERVDRLNREIKFYLTRLGFSGLSEEESAREMALLETIHNLENIGDIIHNNLIELGRKKIYKGLRFSDMGSREIEELHRMVGGDFELLVAAFIDQNPDLAHELVKRGAVFNERERGLRAAHIQRLHAGLAESIETSAIHLDVLTNLRQIRWHISLIVQPLTGSGS